MLAKNFSFFMPISELEFVPHNQAKNIIIRPMGDLTIWYRGQHDGENYSVTPYLVLSPAGLDISFVLQASIFEDAAMQITEACRNNCEWAFRNHYEALKEADEQSRFEDSHNNMGL
jgi:hypothetical protein